MKKKIFGSYWGKGGGGLVMFNLGYQIFRADKSITKEKNSQTFSYMGHNVNNLNVWILGGGGGWLVASYDWVYLASQL